MTAELTIVSFNLHLGHGRRFAHFPPFDPVAAARVLDTDVLVLQESFTPDGGEGHHEAIARELGYEAHAIVLARATVHPVPAVLGRISPAGPPEEALVGDGTWSLAVLSRLPMEAVRTSPLPQLRHDMPARVVLHVDLRVDGAPLTVCGTHLAHLERGVLKHRPMLHAALPSPDTAALLIGDMNMWSPFMSYMAPSGWRRVGRGRTFPSKYRTSRIDHLVVTPGVEVLHTEVIADLGSDHRPIRARVRLR